MDYLVIYEKSNDDSIWARVPGLDGCYSCGDTIEEVKENVKEAIALYLESFSAEGEPIPQSSYLHAELVNTEILGISKLKIK